MEVITWNRALSDYEMWTSMEYLNWKLQEILPHHPAAESSMVAWFKSEDARPVWKSAVGSWQGGVTKGSVTRKVEPGNGATRPVAYLAGDPNSGYDFGVAYYSAWVTPWDLPSNTDWLVMCGSNKGVVYVGNERRNIAVHHGVLHNADFNLYINEGWNGQESDFGVMEVITWNRALSEDEMWTSMEYLNWKLQVGQMHVEVLSYVLQYKL
ncbi:unnamed protein product [Symbiodinium sp. KB8]|nr:unnamed protein product [Symbiodinium sp. KB8]